MFQIIKTVKSLILQEEGNIVSVNLASGSKVQAIGCMMASMMFNDDKNVNPFYVEAKEYLGFLGKAMSKGIKDIEYIPTYEIQKPEDRHIQALKIIVENNGKISKKEMAKIAIERKLIIVNAENENQATFASLDKNIISILEHKWGFVKVNKIGRTRWIEITKEGRNASEFLWHVRILFCFWFKYGWTTNEKKNTRVFKKTKRDQSVNCIVYIANHSRTNNSLKPEKKYLNRLLEGKEFLSEDYFSNLKDIETTD